MEPNLLKYIWIHSKRQQLIVLGATLLFFPILYLTLELPKWIINDALNGSAEQKYFFGQPVEAITYLAILCVLLLSLVISSGVIKMRLNTYKGVVGERLVRRLRYNLIQNTLRFPLPYFSRTSSGELISTVTAETEPLGGYIGEAVAMPVYQGGTMITILIFMFMQDWVFGLISIAVIPIQGYLIPRLQQQVNTLKKERVRQVRKLSERIGETVAGATEIRLHGTQPYTLSEYSRRLGDLFVVRLEIFRKKYFMKFLNNTLSQITPFFFYLFGGYLVIRGDLTIGALVAAIAAYKDLTSPWRELLNYYQLHEDSKVKYQQIVELFTPDQLVEIDEIESVDDRVPLDGNIAIQTLSWRNETGEPVLSGINLQVKSGSMIAITGDYAIRRARLAQILAGIEHPTSGSYLIDGKTIDQIPDSILRRRLALQGPDPHMFVGTVVENMEYGLQQHEPDTGDSSEHRAEFEEALAAGNRAPIDQGWLDYRQAGQSSRERSADWLMRVTQATGSSKLVEERRLLEIFNPDDKPELARELLAARQVISQRLSGSVGEAHLVRFHPQRFNPNTTIAENILFGIAADERLSSSTYDIHPYFREVLERRGLTQKSIELGAQAGYYLMEMLDKNTLSSIDIEHFGLDDEDNVARIRQTLENHKNSVKLSDSCHCLLISLFLMLIQQRHGFVSLDQHVLDQIVVARQIFMQHLPAELHDAVLYFEENAYHPKLTVKDNLLFGRVSNGNPMALRTIDALIEEVIAELGLAHQLSLLLGESQVGISGSRLPLVAKHRISLGRSLIKKPSILILHDALLPMDAEDRKKIQQGIRELLPDSTIIWIAREVDDPDAFDEIYGFTEAGPLRRIDQAHGIDEKIDLPEVEAVRTSNAMDLIANSVLFSELAPEYHRYIANHSQLVSMDSNTAIYEAGDTADSAWMVVSGEVTTTRRRGDDATVAGVFTRPEVFGAIDVMADCPRLMNAATSKDSLLLRIDAGAIESVVLSDPTISRTLLRSLSTQWRSP